MESVLHGWPGSGHNNYYTAYNIIGQKICWIKIY